MQQALDHTLTKKDFFALHDDIKRRLRGIFTVRFGAVQEEKLPWRQIEDVMVAREAYRVGVSDADVETISKKEKALRKKIKKDPDAVIEAIAKTVDEYIGRKLRVAFDPVEDTVAPAVPKEKPPVRAPRGKSQKPATAEATPAAEVAADITTTVSAVGEMVQRVRPNGPLDTVAQTRMARVKRKLRGAATPPLSGEDFINDGREPSQDAARQNGSVPQAGERGLANANAPAAAAEPVQPPPPPEPKGNAARIFMTLRRNPEIVTRDSIQNILRSFVPQMSRFVRDDIPFNHSGGVFTLQLYNGVLAPLGLRISRTPAIEACDDKADIQAASLKIPKTGERTFHGSLHINSSEFMAVCAYYDVNIGHKVGSSEEWTEVWALAQAERRRQKQAGSGRAVAV